MRPNWPKPPVGTTVRVMGRTAVVEACWDDRGGPRNVLVRFEGTLTPERTVVHVSRIRAA